MSKINHPQKTKDHSQSQAEHGVKGAVQKPQKQLTQNHWDGNAKNVIHGSSTLVV
jgi:hypothetical protein